MSCACVLCVLFILWVYVCVLCVLWVLYCAGYAMVLWNDLAVPFVHKPYSLCPEQENASTGSGVPGSFSTPVPVSSVRHHCPVAPCKANYDTAQSPLNHI